MRDTYVLPSGATVRDFAILRTILLSILTVGIYYLVVTYKHTKDMQAASEWPLGSWEVYFWIGILFGPLRIVLWVYNMQALQRQRAAAGLTDDSMGIVSLVMAIVVAPVGQILWAVHVNSTLRELGQLRR